LNTASMDSYRNVLWQDVRGEVSGSWQALRRYHVDTPGLLNSHVYVRVGTHVLSCCLEVRGRGPAHVIVNKVNGTSRGMTGHGHLVRMTDLPFLALIYS